MRSNKYGLGLAIAAACMAFGAGTGLGGHRHRRCCPATSTAGMVVGRHPRNGATWASRPVRRHPLGEGSLELPRRVAPTWRPAPGGDKVQILTNRYDGTAAERHRRHRLLGLPLPGNAQGSPVAMAALNIRVGTDCRQPATPTWCTSPTTSRGRRRDAPARLDRTGTPTTAATPSGGSATGSWLLARQRRARWLRSGRCCRRRTSQESTTCGPANAFTPCPGHSGSTRVEQPGHHDERRRPLRLGERQRDPVRLRAADRVPRDRRGQAARAPTGTAAGLPAPGPGPRALGA